MKRYRVKIEPPAEEQLDEIIAWWTRHRPKHPGLVNEELAKSIAELEGNPEAGVVVESRRYRGARRLLLLRSQYHLYYRVDHDRQVIWIEAVWGAARGSGPPLR